MTKIKELFEQSENGTLTFDQFQEACKAAKVKLVDLSEGNYVDKKKYTDDLAGKDSQIESLNGTIKERDTDLEKLKGQLEAAGTDVAKLQSLTNDFSALQAKYDADMKASNEKLSKQAYEFAVKDFANSKKFTSNAAKRDFVQSMIAKGLQMDGDTILGANEFVTAYTEANEDAFMSEEDNSGEEVPPQFVGSTPGDGKPADAADEFAKAFHFTPIRNMPE